MSDSRTSKKSLTRRDVLRLSAAVGVSAAVAVPEWASISSQAISGLKDSGNVYSEVLKVWCDGLIARQHTATREPAFYGGLLCPACVLIHGRCGDAVYPLLRAARQTGDSKYIQAALRVHEWSQKNVSRPDGSWVNDVVLSSWKGITVFHAAALAEALHHHGELLDAKTRQQWTDRLSVAAKFLDGFITIETGNINYPVTATFCFAACAEALGDSHYLDRARNLAHIVLDYFTPAGFLYGEGHPLRAVTTKKCRPVDLGYNVEESLPSLALYALIANDKQVLEHVIAALKTYMEFMLPDGSWDNSWGSRNYKWSWWGSRTSDGCLPAFALLAQHDSRFAEVAWRNLKLMSSCTQDGLLYGGPHYFTHGELPCIHHTFTHSKAVATVLDRGSNVEPVQRVSLPRDETYELKVFRDIGTYLIALGDWRATVTENDFEYVEHVQAGGGSGGGHVTGGALSLLFHKTLGPILSASMTQYQTIEISNQQVHGDRPHMELTPRIECAAGDQVYTSVCDLKAKVDVSYIPDETTFDARGRLLTASGQPVPDGDVSYHLTYRLSPAKVEIIARADKAGPAPLRFLLPVVSQNDERVERPDIKTVSIRKAGGRLTVRTNSPKGFAKHTNERTFNLVPGFECLALELEIEPNFEITVELSAEV